MAEVDKHGRHVVISNTGVSPVSECSDTGETPVLHGDVMNHEPVIAALEQQVGCYRKLAKLAELQHVYVQQSQTEELLGVLQSRQVVLDQVADLEQTIAPVKKRWTNYIAEIAADDRSLAESLLAETRKLLEQITTADRNDALVLQQRKLNIGKQINQATAAKQINRVYTAAAYGSPHGRMDVQR